MKRVRFSSKNVCLIIIALVAITISGATGRYVFTISKQCKTNVEVKPKDVFIAVVGDDVSKMALRNDGTVWAWGENLYGALGEGTMQTKFTPIQLKNINEVKDIESGLSNSVAIKSDGTVFVWGGNNGITGNRNVTIKPYCVHLKK